jgi:hypothetical protein
MVYLDRQYRAFLLHHHWIVPKIDRSRLRESEPSSNMAMRSILGASLVLGAALTVASPLQPHDTCTVDGGTGTCASTSAGCPGGSFHAGSGPPWPCAGGDDVQCCIPDGFAPPPPSGTSVGAAVLAKVMTAAGTPYAWGGGSCQGPSHDNPPWQYGDIGYDCPGLVRGKISPFYASFSSLVAFFVL